jgi:phenylalanyl-tRNA synthetase alpha chain
MLPEDLDHILKEAQNGFARVSSRPEWEVFKATVMGPKGRLTVASKGLADVPKVEKPAIGKKLNEIKKAVEACSDEALKRVESLAALATLGSAIDPTLPSPVIITGSRHPISQVFDRVVDIFARAGFTVRLPTELETEWYCFDALNSPANHPSRDMQDTYYMPFGLSVGSAPAHDEKDRYLLGTQTSTAQIRTMLKEKPPVRILAPGRCFRHDDADAGHSSNFHQIEGLYVDRDVSLRDFKSCLDYFIRELFGPQAKTRLRPSYFSFVEPGFELDVMTPNLGRLSNRWFELMGCGMVHPAVLENVGIDPDGFSGYAFGMGVERIAMILQGVDDIRYYYQNDTRLLKQLA